MTAVSTEQGMAGLKLNGNGVPPRPTVAAAANGAKIELEAGESDDDEADDGDDHPHQNSTEAPMKKKKKRKPKKKKKAGAGASGGGAKAQSGPPRIPVAQLFPDGSFPVGEEVEYRNENAYRTTNEEKRHLDRMNQDFLTEYRQAAEVHREVRQYARANIKPGMSLTEIAEMIEDGTRHLTGHLGLEAKRLPNFSLTLANSLTGLRPIKMEQKFEITHVIFDLDGTLIDSEEQYFKLHNECLKTYGKEFRLKEKKAFLGQTTMTVIRKIIESYDLKGVSVEEYRKLYEFHYDRYLSDCPDLPGANKLVHHLHKTNVPMAFCTNSTTAHFELKTRSRYQHWREMIPLTVIAASDREVKLPKPAPDSYIVTMGRFETKPKSPKNVLVFEDSWVGTKAAVDSGASVVMIPQGNFSSDEVVQKIELLRPKLAAVLKSLSDFKPEEFGLPPFN